MIDEADLARLRDAADLVEIASEHVQLKRVGRQWSGICPFHDERSPSLSINGPEGLWWCFGCNQGGDTIEFVRRIHHLDFVEAVEWLARRTGIALTRTTGEQRRSDARSSLTAATAEAAAWYHHQLLHSPAAAAARSYLAGRGLTAELLETFELGWAPAGWDELTQHLGMPSTVLTAAGVAKKNKAGRIQDVFRGRITFPIRNLGGDVLGFGARLLPGADGPKYINSPDGALYQKRHALYGLDLAKARIVSVGEAVVCEGYLDVIASHAAGVANSVASCGTALGTDHLRLLHRFCDRLVLAFDADTAGGAAAARLHDLEARHDFSFVVADLPPGADPGDLGFVDPERLRTAIGHTTPLLAFMVDRSLSNGRTDTIEDRVRTAYAALDVVAQHPDRLVRDQYMMRVADRLQLDSKLLRDRLNEALLAARQRTAPETPEVAPDELGALPAIEGTALQVAADTSAQLWWMDASLFADPRAKAVVEALLACDDIGAALVTLEGAGHSLLLMVAAGTTSPPDDVDEIGARLVQAAIERRISDLSATDDATIATVTALRRQLQAMRNAAERTASAQAGLELLSRSA